MEMEMKMDRERAMEMEMLRSAFNAAYTLDIITIAL